MSDLNISCKFCQSDVTIPLAWAEENEAGFCHTCCKAFPISKKDIEYNKSMNEAAERIRKEYMRKSQKNDELDNEEEEQLELEVTPKEEKKEIPSGRQKIVKLPDEELDYDQFYIS